MDIKQRVKLYAIVALSAVLGKHVRAQNAIDSVRAKVVYNEKLPAMSDKNADDTLQLDNDTLPLSENEPVWKYINEDVRSNDWIKTNVGSSYVRDWYEVMVRNGVINNISEQNVADLKAIAELPREMRYYRTALENYKLDGEDLLLIKSDSMALASDSLASKGYTGIGKYCFHAGRYVYGNLNPIALLSGASAYQAVPQLKKNPNFVPALLENYSVTDKAPSGCIVVFYKGVGAPDGHFYTAGQGFEEKTFKTKEGKVITYTRARDKSDVERNSNVTGNRGKVGRYGTPYIFFTQGSLLGAKTQLLLGYQAAKQNSGKIAVTPADVLSALQKINDNSYKKTDELKPNSNDYEVKTDSGYYKYPRQSISKMPAKYSRTAKKRRPSATARRPVVSRGR